MGCCHSKIQVQGSTLRNKINLEPFAQGEVVEILKEKSFESFEMFKKTLESKVRPSYPLGINEIERLFRNTLHLTLKDFDSCFILPVDNPEVMKEYSIYKKYLISKCKAEEGLFRYLNDTYSCRMVFKLHLTLISEMLAGTSTKEEIIERFKKLAKGTYLLSGIKKLYDFIEVAGMPDVDRIIKEEEERQIKELEDNREQLDRASRKAILPVQDSFEASGELDVQGRNESFSFVSENEMDQNIVKNGSFSMC